MLFSLLFHAVQHGDRAHCIRPSVSVWPGGEARDAGDDGQASLRKSGRVAIQTQGLAFILLRGGPMGGIC